MNLLAAVPTGSAISAVVVTIVFDVAATLLMAVSSSFFV
jgi:hypothetical protein